MPIAGSVAPEAEHLGNGNDLTLPSVSGTSAETRHDHVATIARNAALEAEILKDRNDPAPYLVYADWLLSQGDPRGELIVIQHALRHEYAETRKPFARVVDAPAGKKAPPLPNKAELVAREQQLADSYLSQWARVGAAEQAQFLKLRWRYGFIESASFVLSADSRTGLAPQAVHGLLALPAAALIRGLNLRLPKLAPAERVDHVAFLEGLAKRNDLAPIERLRLSRLSSYRESLDRPLALGAFLRGLPQLRSLELDQAWLSLNEEPIDAARLRQLTLTSCVLSAGFTSRLSAMQFPSLHTLALQPGGWSASGEALPAEVEMLRHLFSGRRLPRIKRLTLGHFGNGDELIAVLIHSPVLKRLEFLNLARSPLSSAGAQHILNNAQRFRHLRELVIDSSRLEAAEIEALAGICKRVFLARSSGQLRQAIVRA